MVVGVALFFDRLRGSAFRWDIFFATFAQLNQGWLWGGIFLGLLSYPGRALRWQVMMRPVCANPSLRHLVSATIIGFTAVVLFGRAGELVRPYLIAVRERVAVSSQIATWLLERVYDLLIVLILFGFALTQANGAEHLGARLQSLITIGGYIVVVLAVACLSILYMLSSHSEMMKGRLLDAIGILPEKYKVKASGFINAFMGGMESTQSVRFLFQILALTVAEWALICWSTYCLLKAFPATASLTVVDVLVFTGFVAFGGVVQIPGIGGGLQIAAALVLTEFFGLSLELASGMALLLWAATWLPVVPFGILLTFVEGIKWSSLSHIQESPLE